MKRKILSATLKVVFACKESKSIREPINSISRIKFPSKYYFIKWILIIQSIFIYKNDHKILKTNLKIICVFVHSLFEVQKWNEVCVRYH